MEKKEEDDCDGPRARRHDGLKFPLEPHASRNPKVAAGRDLYMGSDRQNVPELNRGLNPNATEPLLSRLQRLSVPVSRQPHAQIGAL